MALRAQALRTLSHETQRQPIRETWSCIHRAL